MTQGGRKGDRGSRRTTTTRSLVSLAAAAGALLIWTAAASATSSEYPTEIVNETIFGGEEREHVVDTKRDAAGNVYIAGWTQSPDFPRRGGLGISYGPALPPPPNLVYSQGFVAKISPVGNLVYSTLLPLDLEKVAGLAVDGEGAAYVVSPDSTFGNGPDVRVLKLAPSGREIKYDTAFGSSIFENADDIAVDGAGRVVVVGRSAGEDFPTTPGTRVPDEHDDGYVTRLDSDGSVLQSARIEGLPRAVEIGPDGDIYIAGSAEEGTFDGIPGARPQPGTAGDYDGSVVRLSADLSTVRTASVIGGSRGDRFEALDVAPDGTVYAAGVSYGSRFDEILPLLREPKLDHINGFYAEIAPGGTEVAQLSVIGGDDADVVDYVALAGDGAVLLAGRTNSGDFPAHGAPDVPGEIITGSFVTRVEDRQLSHSSVFTGLHDAYAGGVVSSDEGLAHLGGVSRPTLPPPGSEKFIPNYQAFMTTLRLAPYVDGPEVEYEPEQSPSRTAARLTAGAAEEVMASAGGIARLRYRGKRRRVRLGSSTKTADAYEKVQLRVKPRNKRGRKLIKRALRGGKTVRLKARVRFEDRGGARANEKARLRLVAR